MRRLSFIIRWLARILSLVMLALVLRFAIGEGAFNPMDFIPEERGAYVALLAMMIAGLLAWRWEVLGGLLVLAGTGLYWYFDGSWVQGGFALFPVEGCLFLIAWLLEHKPGVALAPHLSEGKTIKKKGRRKRKRERGAAGKNA